MIEGIGKVGVVGLGVMGFDIAFLYAMKGFHTSVYDASKAVMESLTDRREQTLERLKRRNRISDNETENIRKLLMPAAFRIAFSWSMRSRLSIFWHAGRASKRSIKLRKRCVCFRRL